MFMNINHIFIQATDNNKTEKTTADFTRSVGKIPSSYSCASCPHNIPLGEKCTHQWPSNQLTDLALEWNTAIIAKEAPLKICNSWWHERLEFHFILRIHVLCYISAIPDSFTLMIYVTRECRK